MYKALLYFPLCLIRGIFFPVLAVGAIVATIAYVANAGTDK